MAKRAKQTTITPDTQPPEPVPPEAAPGAAAGNNLPPEQAAPPAATAETAKPESPEPQTGQASRAWVNTVRSEPAKKVEIKQDRQAGLVLIKFEEKPAAEVRAQLKANGFDWVPVKMAWGRQSSPATLRLAEKIVGEIAPPGRGGHGS